MVNVRTSECKHFLALLPPDDDLTLSSSSTLKHLGASADESLDLSEQPLGRSAITEALQDCFNSEQTDERAHELVRLAMAQAKVLDQAGAESSHQWMLLERLFEYRGQLTGWARLLASAGMPAPYPDGSSSPKDYEKALTRLALELENRGFGEAIANLSNATDDVAVKDALVAAIDHIRSQCLVPSRFSEAPSCFYFPFSTDEPTKLPTWWSVLRVDVLQQLFDVTDPAPAALQASCIGPLIEPGLGLPYVVQTAPTVQVRFPDDESPRRVLIYRGKTARNREFVAELDPDITGEPWTDPGPIPTANGPIRYWLSADGLEEASLRVIVLDSFEPGLLLHTKTAEALQAFRRIKKKKGTTSGTQGTEWECEIHLNGVGTHQLEIYASSNFPLALKRSASMSIRSRMRKRYDPLTPQASITGYA